MALTRTLACQNCRQWLLKSFISTFNIPQAPPPQRRNFSAPTRRWNEARERIQQAEKDAFALNDINEDVNSPQKQSNQAEAEGIPPTAAETTAEHIPWYLRTTTTSNLPSSTAPSDFSARQQIPHLPTNPPPLLAPLLQQISVDLGIDDLVLLDLRSLDPPPALGANLLMIIGTARSEKHLHVSADKLCRWLRSEHFLSPYADGLLGRQELKLKLRRRAKRARLLGAVGGKAEQDDVADGIRTGWVCVNIGEVPAAEGEEEQGERVVEREGSFVGFGPGRRDGCRVVVQMLTEEKRGEVDLEKLWGAVLRKSEREREALLNAEAVEEELEGVEDGVEGVKAEAEEGLAEVETTAEEGSEQHSTPPFRPLQNQQQVRAYHTSARRLQGTIETSSPENTTLDSISQSAEAQQTQQPPSPEQASEEASEFYKAFTSMPALRLPRPAPLYTALFNHISSGAFNSPSSTRPITRDDWTMIGNRAEEPTNSPQTSHDHQTLAVVQGFAEARAVLGETLSAMDVEEPAVDIEGEGGVELGMAIMKAIKFVDPNAVIGEFGPWRARCERVLRMALEGYKA